MTTIKGSITRHRGWWCLRYRERIREGDALVWVLRSKRIARVDSLHKTKRSVERLAESMMEPVNAARKNPNESSGAIFRLGEFVETKYFPAIEGKREASTIDGYKKTWNRYLNPRCANWLMHDRETHHFETMLDEIAKTENLGAQTMAHVRFFLSGVYDFAIHKGYLAKGTTNPLIGVETSKVEEAETRAYTAEETILLLDVLPPMPRTIVAVMGFAALRNSEVRGLQWPDYLPANGNQLGMIQINRKVWRGRIGKPKTKKSKAPVPVIPQLAVILEEHRRACGGVTTGPIFPGRKPAIGCDLDGVYRHHMKSLLRGIGFEWEGWYGLRRGTATTLDRLGVPVEVAAMILRHTNSRTTEKHYVKRAPAIAIDAMRRFSEGFAKIQALREHEMFPTVPHEGTKEVPNTRVQ